MQAVDQHISLALNHYASEIEKHFECDVLAYTGPIFPMGITRYRDALERLVTLPKPAHTPGKLVIVLTTPGGVVEAVEKMVGLTRHYYFDVSFVVPDMAMSAGTVWCMSGGRIWMDYSASLGPIDPQVQSTSTNGGLVPALGYLDKVNEFIDRAREGKITSAELVLLKSVDLAELHRYEQARDLSISLLKQWLVAFKFKNWTTHRTTNPGCLVTPQEKEQRAEQIAKQLADNKHWHSHGRMIGMKVLQNDLRLEVDDFSDMPGLRDNVRMYSTLLTEYVERHKTPMIIHSTRG